MIDHVKKFKRLLKKKEKMVCMLAPSFIAEFEYPQFVYRLRKLGFTEVVELTFGAKMTNLTYYSILKNNLEKTWITSPCPTLVNYIRTKYPQLVDNLVPVHSPMGCMSLICKKFYPNYRQVFVGPCITKKMEAEEIKGISCVLTFKEIQQIFDEYKIPEKITESKYCRTFDKFYNDYTKVYPLSGGLSETLHHEHLFKKNEVLVMEGVEKIDRVLSEFKDGKYKKYKLFDILTCKGGCIDGPGMLKRYSLSERKKRVRKYMDYTRRYEKDLGRTGTKIEVKDVDFRRVF